MGRGDLSPPRRHHRRRGRTLVVIVLILASLAVAGWFGWRALRGDSAGLRAQAPACVQPTRPPTPAAPGDVHVRVLNATNRAGLAHDVADRLRARGFRIAGVGNYSSRLPATIIQRGAADLAAATAVEEQLRGAEQAAADVRVVTLLLGRDFRGLAPKRLAARQHAGDVRRASSSPSPCPSSPG
jgi:hypothetical protein